MNKIVGFLKSGVRSRVTPPLVLLAVGFGIGFATSGESGQQTEDSQAKAVSSGSNGGANGDHADYSRATARELVKALEEDVFSIDESKNAAEILRALRETAERELARLEEINDTAVDREVAALVGAARKERREYVEAVSAAATALEKAADKSSSARSDTLAKAKKRFAGYPDK